jgi:Leucine-rich repeat (LRR) protein
MLNLFSHIKLEELAMASSESLLKRLAPVIGKSLVEIVVGQIPVVKDLVPALIDMADEKSKQTTAGDEAKIKQIGDVVASELQPLILSSGLQENEIAAVLHEFGLTLASFEPKQLVYVQLDPEHLSSYLLASRIETTRSFSGRERAVYEKLVRSVAVALVESASELRSFGIERDAKQMREQTQILDTVLALSELNSFGIERNAKQMQELSQILDAVLALLRQPEGAVRTFEEDYQRLVCDELNKLEMFGVPRLKEAMDRQKLDIAYVTVTVEGHEHLRHQVTTDEQLNNRTISGPINQILASERRIIVRGVAGSGKTTLLRWLAVQIAGQAFRGDLSQWNKTIPFYIRLRKVDTTGFPTPNQYVALIDEDLAEQQPENNWAHQQLKHGRAVMLIDGIDELPKERRATFLERLQRLVRKYPLVRYIITSRPAATSRETWPEWYEWAAKAGFSEVMIQPMDHSAVEVFIDHWHKAYAQGSPDDQRRAIRQSALHLKSLLPRRTDLFRLADNPLLCSMICALHHESQHHLPVERLKLYQECIDMMLERRDSVRGIAPNNAPKLTLSQKHALLQALALRMMRNGEIELAVERVDKLFADELPAVGIDASAAQTVRIDLIERSGLLREPVLGQIDFTHRTFQEFFAAQEIVDDGEFGQLLQQTTNPQWRDTFPLIAGKMRPKEVHKLLQDLIVAGTPLAQRALALACLETTVKVEPSLRQQVFAAVVELFPPYHNESKRILAAAGEHAIPYLNYDRQPNIAAITACIETLALIGGEQALQAIEGYAKVKHPVVQAAIDRAWPNFDPQNYAQRLLSQRTSISISEAGLLPFLNYLPNLWWLSLSGTQITNLESLGNLTSLQQLVLSGTQITNLEPLGNLTSLQQLDLSGTQITDFKPLGNLTSLQQLDLSGTQITDFEPLGNLTSLQQLSLSHTQITDFEPLSNLTSLQQLDLSDTQITDLEPLSNLTSLQQLDLSGTQIADLEPLGNLTSLQQLRLFNTQITDLEPLGNLTSLQQLRLFNTQITDLEPLGNLTSLQQLDLSGTQITDFEPLSNLTSLQQLDLSGTQITDFEPLGNLASLQQLSLSGTQITDLELLGNLTSLQQLSLSGTQITDLEPLGNFTSLQQLSLSGTQITDLELLGNLTSLQQLSLSGTQITDLEPLGNLTSLQQLSLSGTQITDLEPLGNFTSLQQLILFNTPVANLGPLRYLTSLQQLRLFNTQVKDLQPLAQLPNLISVSIHYVKGLGDAQLFKSE